jgi:acyl dehydratase
VADAATEKRIFSDSAELTAAVGEHLGYSEWVVIDQGRIDAFADATGDHQWIHVDPERAASGPFGTTVAHGYLTLSLVPVLVSSLLDYAGWPVKINYGSNKVRFPTPVPVDRAVRAGVEVAAVTEVPAGLQVAMKVTVEIRNPSGEVAGKPALVAETLTLLAR